MRNRFFFMIAIIIATLSGCATKLPIMTEFDKAPLFGMIYDADGVPVHNASVLINGETGPLTDINGRFVIPNLPRGNHILVIHKEGYSSTTTSFDFMNKSQVLYLKMNSARQHYSKAVNHFECGLFRESLIEVQSTLDLDKDFYSATYLQVLILIKLKQFDEIPLLIEFLRTNLGALQEVDELEKMYLHEVNK